MNELIKTLRILFFWLRPRSPLLLILFDPTRFYKLKDITGLYELFPCMLIPMKNLPEGIKIVDTGVKLRKKN